MANTRVQTTYDVGDIVPFSFSPGIVVASFFVSLTGAITTVELLHRRTNGEGWYNWVQLGSCATSMGLIAIWCMHYVGNQAIVLGGGDPSLQLMYSPGFTALSSFIPIIALFAAFTIADLRYHGRKSLLASMSAAGVIAGLATVGMHYTGNLGVSNFSIDFDLKYVGGAIGIACAACVGALTLFFVLQEHWLNRFHYRILCAIVLAGAVSGMHFEASIGTTYRLKHRTTVSNSKHENVIIAIVLSLLTIPICIGIAISTSRRRRQLADRAQQVVLAYARFDPDGKLMVTHEGLLPCRKITVQHNQRSFEEEFNVTHPVFQWLFRLSHNWSSLARYKEDIRSHLNSVNFRMSGPRKSTNTDSPLPWDSGADEQDYSVIFRESFYIAACDLAAELKKPLSDIGVLYDRIMMTGTLPRTGNLIRRRSIRDRLSLSSCTTVSDDEGNIGVDVFGRGQLLFLADQMCKKEVSKFNSMGYRLVSVEKISDHLSQSMQVPVNYLMSNLNDLRTYVQKETVEPMTGSLLACFALRAGVSKKRWEILVQKDYPDRLPAVSLSNVPLNTYQVHLLTHLDGLSVTNCLAYLVRRSADIEDPDTSFWDSLKIALTKLIDGVAETFFKQAIFCARPIRIRTHDRVHNTTVYCQLFAFHIIPDVHTSSLKPTTTQVMYSSFSFFRCRQQVRSGLHSSSFERNVHREFSNLFSTGPSSSRPSIAGRPNFSSISPHSKRPIHRWNALFSSSQTSPRSSNPVLVRTSDESTLGPDMPFGGIMVSSDVTVESAPKEEGDLTILEMLNFGSPPACHPNEAGSTSKAERVGSITRQITTSGTRAHACVADGELPTYVDELYNIAVARWRGPGRVIEDLH